MMLFYSRRILFPACFIFLFFTSLYWLQGERFNISSIARPPPGPHRYKNSGAHPIDHLRAQAEADFQALISKQLYDEAAAAKAYESRRGRRPPPGYAQWLAFAREKEGVIVEDFFDRIYKDLAPFWAVPPQILRRQAGRHHMRIDVRGGEASIISHYDAAWMNLWGDLIGTIAQYLPDLSVPINDMDESRVIAPWEQITSNMKDEAKSRRIVPKKKMITEYSTTGDYDGVDPYEGIGDIWTHEGQYWNLTVAACAPDSPARAKHHADFNFETSLPGTGGFPEHSYQGYVSNWTLAKSPCDYPILQQMHGSFVEPLSLATTTLFIPMFGGSKLPMNNDILLPPAMYWSDDERFDIGENDGGSWDFKHGQILWRGASTGGKNRKENWTRFQRHRFVSIMNATTVAFAEENPEGRAPNFVLPDRQSYQLHAESLASWVKESADVAFGDILCFPEDLVVEEYAANACPYNAAWFDSGHKMPLTEELNYKYLPDIDGNSFSGRYRAFLMSTSLPIKATVYDEWHDSRLVPWKHFVPMDNTFTDLYGIMEYFMGSKGHEGMAESDVSSVGHDEVARDIALSGKAWAKKVLRKEDMQIYVFRLLLEWARLLDDNRERLGWIPSGQ